MDVHDDRCGPRADSISCVLDGCLEHAKTLTRCLLGVLVTLPLVFGFQAGPLVRVHCLEVRSLVVAIGGGLWREQRRVEPADRRLRMLVLFGGSTGGRPDPDSGHFQLMERQIGFVLRGIARAIRD